MGYTTIDPNPLRHIRESPEREEIPVDTPKVSKNTVLVKKEPPRVTQRWMWASIAFLGGAVAGLYWFGYRNLDILTTHAPQLVPSVQAVGDTLTGRVDRLEQKVREWDGQNLGGRLTSLEQSVDKSLTVNTQQAKNAAESVATKLRSDVRAENTGVKTELVHVQSQLKADQTRLATVQAELSRVQKDVATHNARLDAAEYNRNADRHSMLTNVAQVRRGVDDRKEDIARVQQNLQMNRIDFEASKGRSTKIAEGIQLNLTGINIARRQVDGWVWVMPDRKTVWVRDLNALQPFAFYSDGDSRRRELVITRVTNDAAIGYLLESKIAATAQARPAPSTEVATGSGL